MEEERGGRLYVCSDERCLFALGRTVEDLFGWGIRGQRQGGKGVHDEVDPEELDGFQDRLHVWVVDGGGKGEDNSGNIDGNLELWEVSMLRDGRDKGGGGCYLEELLDGVVDGSSPFQGCYNGCEVVVHEDNGGRLLGDFCTRDAH